MYMDAPSMSARVTIRFAFYQYLVQEAGMRFLVRDDKSGFYCTSSRKATLSKIEQTLRGGKLPKTPGSPGHSEHGKILNWKKDLDRIVHRVLGSGDMTKSDKQLRSQPSNNLETQVPDAAAFESSLPLRSSNADGRNKQEMAKACESGEKVSIKPRDEDIEAPQERSVQASWSGPGRNCISRHASKVDFAAIFGALRQAVATRSKVAGKQTSLSIVAHWLDCVEKSRRQGG